jgi:hypothetical protein
MPTRRDRWPRGGVLFLLAIPVGAWAGAADTPSRAGPVLFALALLVVAAKCGGVVAERWGQPSVLGELLVGIGAGNLLPSLFGERGIAFVRGDPTLHVLAEIGVLVLLFDVGLEADLRALVRVGPSAALVAAIGVITPFAFGWGTARWLLPEAPLLAHLFVGATLTATSVGITARVLKDLGSLQSREGQVILGAAVLDDILGLVVLAVLTGLVTATATGGPGLSGLAVAGIILKALVFLGMTVGLGHRLSGPIVRLAGRTGQHNMLLVFGLAICFALAFIAERIGLAGIVGAFAAGLLLDPYGGRGAHPGGGGDPLGAPASPVEPVRAALLRADGDPGRRGEPRDSREPQVRRGAGARRGGRQARVRGRRGRARDQSTCRRHWDGPSRRSGSYLRGDWCGPRTRWPFPPVPGGVLGRRLDGCRHDAPDADRAALDAAAREAGPTLLTIQCRGSV